ncbi:EEF1A lysine methyltransferase 2 [Lamellibrachia satsuma]|nr:EEF1A lysine methyltransferase 2 [Lamellibrachia satsuma]
MAAPTETRDECHGELTSSKLGTKEYWDQMYEEELKAFHEIGDSGEIWFGIESVERVVNWLENSPLTSLTNNIVDLGCGNAAMLLELYKRGFCNLVGVDYSSAAVMMAEALAEKENAVIRFERCDLLLDTAETCSSMSSSTYHVCIDKGTYDAISLMQNNAKLQRNCYIRNVHQILMENGLLVITSCNWTQEELMHQFESSFTLLQKIPTPTFNFGGQTGNRETVSN